MTTAVIEYVEFERFTVRSTRKLGRIILQDGKLRAEGGDVVEGILGEKLRDFCPKGDRSRYLTKADGKRFLEVLRYAYHGGYIEATAVKEKRRRASTPTGRG